MDTRQAVARRAGVVYFAHMMVAIYTEFVFPRQVVAGDATATALQIIANERTYRTGILLDAITLILLLFVVGSLYRLLREVDETDAVVMVVLVAIGVAVALNNLLNRLAPLVLLGDTAFLSAFSRAQLETLGFAALRYRGNASAIPLAFWGFWLFPFGRLVMRSGFLPRLLGVLLMVAGSAYLISSTTAILWPEFRSVVTRWATPLYFGEVPIIFWLLFLGARDQLTRMRSSAESH